LNFTNKLQNAVSASKSTLCVGLDPVQNRILEYGNLSIFDYCAKIIELTHDFCAAYKPNYGFFEALGENGIKTLNAINNLIPSDKIIVADAKRGDIGSTAEQYAQAFWDKTISDAVTINPLMGLETLRPFLQKSDKCAYALVMTSNVGAKDFLLQPFGGMPTFSSYIARSLKNLQSDVDGHIGMVIGATQTDLIKSVISEFPEASLLIPGVGSQGGNIASLEVALQSHRGIPLINVTRDIIYPIDLENWEKGIRDKAKFYRDQLQNITNRYV
jgi:orotidine-5'-phosphate decarboxylase